MTTANEVIERILELDGKANYSPWWASSLGTVATEDGEVFIAKCSHQDSINTKACENAELIAYYRTAAVQCARALRVAIKALENRSALGQLQEIESIFNGNDAGNEGRG